MENHLNCDYSQESANCDSIQNPQDKIGNILIFPKIINHLNVQLTLIIGLCKMMKSLELDDKDLIKYVTTKKRNEKQSTEFHFCV